MKTVGMSIDLVQVACYSIEIFLSTMLTILFYEDVKSNFLKGDFTFSILSIIATICAFAVLVRSLAYLCTIDIEDVESN